MAGMGDRMALESLAVLDQYKRSGAPAQSVPYLRTFYAPVDDVHGALLALLDSVQHSLVIDMYGLTDPAVFAVLKKYLDNPQVMVQINLDRTQAAGKSERELLASLNNDAIGNSVAIGTSEKAGAIAHRKLALIDGLDLITGSTNWSVSGESLQENIMHVLRDGPTAAEARTRMDILHTDMLRQMIARLKG